jgi:hypothetical protein
VSLEHLPTVAIVYASALLPMLVLGVLHRRNMLAPWVLAAYVAALVFSAAGWEVWFTYGLVEGDPVDARRPAALAAAIPQHVNWLLNSLADAGTVCLGGLLLVWCAYRFHLTPFLDWKWPAFTLLFVWFVGQNVLVELTIYHEQLALGTHLSWAPLIPTGPWYNPTLYTVGDRTIRLQTQLPWVLMTPLFYATTIACCRRWNEPT